MLRKSKKLILCAVLAVLFSQAFLPASAESYQRSYNYNSWGQPESVPEGYSCTDVITGGFNGALDLYYANDRLYVLDSGNMRVAVYDSKFNYLNDIKGFYIKENGVKKESPLNTPSGIYVAPDGRLVIADTGNARVIVCRPDGEIILELLKPQNDTFPKELSFKPVKAVMDDLNNVYVLSEGFYYGAIVYNDAGENTSFFGASKIKVTAALLADMFWRQFMTDKQLDYTNSYVPNAFTSLDIDKNNFIYTCSSDSDDSIRKLNFLGQNIFEPEVSPDPLRKDVYGDRVFQWNSGTSYTTVLCDIAVSDNDFVYVLDSARGRIFEYDQESNLLNIFGGKANQKGTFKTPIAIETIGDSVLVLDQDKAAVYIFKPTNYGKLLHEATGLYNDGLFTDAYDKWQEVLKYNSNSEIIYRGIGRAYLQLENYTEAMRYAKLGQDRLGYSKAFRFYRSELVKDNFIWIIAAIALIIVGGIAYKVYKKKHATENKSRVAFRAREVFTSPILLYERLFSDHTRQPIVLSSVIISLFFLGQVITTVATGFVFNTNDVSQFNVLFVLAQTIGLVVLWVVSDKVTGSLRFGHGTVRGIYTGTAAALIPYTITLYINVILSLVLTYEESAIMGIISTIGLMYTVFLLFQSVRIIQQYTVKEAITSFILNAVVALIILLLLVVVFMLLRQVVIFGQTVVNELLYRID